MDERSRDKVRVLLERARSDWKGVEFIVYVHPDRLDALADAHDGPPSGDDPTLRTFMGADLRAWDVGMKNPPSIDEVHVNPFYGRVLPQGIPAYFVDLSAEPVN